MDKIIFWRDSIVIWTILRAFPVSCRFIRHSLVKLVQSCIKSFSIRCNITWQRYNWIPPNWPPSWICISKAAPEHHNLRDLLQDRCISFSEVSLKSGCRVHEHNPQRGERSREVSQSPELILVPRFCDGSSGPENYEFLIQHMQQSRAIRFKDQFFCIFCI